MRFRTSIHWPGVFAANSACAAEHASAASAAIRSLRIIVSLSIAEGVRPRQPGCRRCHCGTSPECTPPAPLRRGVAERNRRRDGCAAGFVELSGAPASLTDQSARTPLTRARGRRPPDMRDNERRRLLFQANLLFLHAIMAGVSPPGFWSRPANRPLFSSRVLLAEHLRRAQRSLSEPM